MNLLKSISNISATEVLYKILKINGLAPFYYSSKNNVVTSTSTSTKSSVLISVIIIGLTLFCEMQISNGYVPFQGKAIEYFVAYIQFYYNVFKISIIFGIQFLYRDKLIRLMNQGIFIKSNLIKFIPNEPFKDYKFLDHFRHRKILSFLQCMALICSICCYTSRTLSMDLGQFIFSFVTVIYINIFAMLTTGIYYNGAMILIDRFYRILIIRIRFLLVVLDAKVINYSYFFLDGR